MPMMINQTCLVGSTANTYTHTHTQWRQILQRSSKTRPDNWANSHTHTHTDIAGQFNYLPSWSYQGDSNYPGIVDSRIWLKFAASKVFDDVEKSCVVICTFQQELRERDRERTDCVRHWCAPISTSDHVSSSSSSSSSSFRTIVTYVCI